jgi:hypothetical protein
MRTFLFAAVIALIGAAVHSGMGSAQEVQYAATPPAVAAPSLNPDLAAGIVTRFYRDVDAGTKASYTDLASLTSSDFDRRHTDDLIQDYAYITDPKIQIAGIRGRTVNYVLDYDYVSDTKTKFFWERVGQWTFNHGAQSGWVLDNDKWVSVHLVGFQTPSQSAMVPVKDVVYGDGRHEFDYMGTRFAFVASDKGWKLSPVSAPAPAPAPVYPTTTADSSTNTTTTGFTPDTAVPDTDAAETTQTRFDDPQAAQNKCASDVVVWVNTNSGVFHFPGTRWYGATANGTYECEADAVSEGDRPSRNGQ